MNSVYIFPSADIFLKAAGWADPDPAYTKLYQKAHIENANRDADAAWRNVMEHAKTMGDIK